MMEALYVLGGALVGYLVSLLSLLWILTKWRAAEEASNRRQHEVTIALQKDLKSATKLLVSKDIGAFSALTEADRERPSPSKVWGSPRDDEIESRIAQSRNGGNP